MQCSELALTLPGDHGFVQTWRAFSNGECTRTFRQHSDYVTSLAAARHVNSLHPCLTLDQQPQNHCQQVISVCTLQIIQDLFSLLPLVSLRHLQLRCPLQRCWGSKKLPLTSLTSFKISRLDVAVYCNVGMQLAFIISFHVVGRL